jgi:hypothetical protein
MVIHYQSFSRLDLRNLGTRKLTPKEVRSIDLSGDQANIFDRRKIEGHKRRQVSRGFWSDLSNQRAFMLHVAQQLKITDFEGWYGVTTSHIRQAGGNAILNLYSGSLASALKVISLYFSVSRPLRSYSPTINGTSGNFLQRLEIFGKVEITHALF